MTQHPTPSQNAPNWGPDLGHWLFAGFTMVSLSPLLYRPAFADTTIWTKASDMSTPVRFCSFSPNMECRKMAGKRVQLLNNYTCRFRPSSLKRADKSGLDRLQAGK